MTNIFTVIFIHRETKEVGDENLRYCSVTQDINIKCQIMTNLSSNTFKLHTQKNPEDLFHTAPDEIVAQDFVEAIGSETAIVIEEKSLRSKCSIKFFSD